MMSRENAEAVREWAEARTGARLGDTCRTTPEEHIERVRAGAEAFNSRDFDTAMAGLRDDVTWDRFLSRAEAEGTVVRGKAELLAVWESQVQAVDLRIEGEELIPVGHDAVVAPTRMIARGSDSGITLSAAVTWVYRFDSSGLIASVEAFEKLSDALDAARRR
jgi:hypothetical protein